MLHSGPTQRQPPLEMHRNVFASYLIESGTRSQQNTSHNKRKMSKNK